jgi:heme exporter protein D
MDAIGAIFHMGGYGIYVWPAFAVAVLVLGWMAWSTIRRLRKNERLLERLQGIREEIARNNAADAQRDNKGKPT